MKLLFVKETFSSKFKDLLGFVDADITFRKVKPSLQAATDDIVDVISQTVYDSLFTGAEINNDNPELLELVQYAVALKAYIIYAPTGDVAVTNTGRFIRKDDLHVSLFKHQVDAHNDGLTQLFYRHLDRLLKYMALNNLPINEKKYKHENLFVPSLSSFEDYFNINNSYLLYLNLLPGLRECERDEILPRIGRTLFDSKNEWFETDIDLFEDIQKACVFYALKWGIERLNVQLFPSGVFSTSDSGNKGGDGMHKTPAGDNPRTQLAQTFGSDVFKTLIKIEKEISKKENSGSLKINLTDFEFDECDKFVDL